MTDVNRQWVLRSRPVGMVSAKNFELREEPRPGAPEGGVLVRNVWVSLDPAMRGWLEDRPSYLPPVQIGEVMRAGGVGQIVESKSPDFAAGDWVQGMFGWQEYVALGGAGGFPPAPVPAGAPPRLALSVLGITGITAYFGLLDVAQPRAGETVVVSGAAGATGSVAAQIARIKGCRSIGIAGGPEKCGWLRDRAKLDAAIDYKSEDVAARLRELCPKGIDVYFDNVGGPLLETVLDQIAQNARIALCGGISVYNEADPPPGPRNLMNLVTRRGRMQGFIVIDYAGRFREAIPELQQWVEAGELAWAEDVQHGLENAPDTLLRLFRGQNLGKQILQLCDPPIAK